MTHKSGGCAINFAASEASPVSGKKCWDAPVAMFPRRVSCPCSPIWESQLTRNACFMADRARKVRRVWLSGQPSGLELVELTHGSKARGPANFESLGLAKQRLEAARCVSHEPEETLHCKHGQVRQQATPLQSPH